ncbi:ATP-binding protein [Chitinophaga filiformis]|uniref:AAA family ATPase n=1 Tax=Chitinophaga filiformis TaxID=104663 RepID=UPI001F3E93D0|nr:ATP-binding protein [Chitinophaga filiformis]MCF6406801.1 ATP-binding protein [Chitinophaga filiformis]
MLIQFSVSNFKTFKNKATLNLIASNYDKETREEENIIQIPEFGLRILKSAVVYGANASGKSRFMDAITFMKNFVIRSSTDRLKGDPINVDLFRLATDTENGAAEFEILFLHNNEMYRYGFEITKQAVLAEWLYHRPKTKEIEIFYREGQRFEFHVKRFSKGYTLAKEDLVRENALLLTVAAQFNDQLSGEIVNWFKKLKVISGLQEHRYQGFTMDKTEDAVQKKRILELLSAADLGIHDIILERVDPDNLPADMPKRLKELIQQKVSEENAEFISDILTTHRRYDADNNYVGDAKFSLEDDESSGTFKFFSLTGPVLDALEHGYPLFIDELDSKLHPNLVCKLIELFNSATYNPQNSQLVFNTHDTNLLSSGLFRRDQIWFTEKDRYGAASLYSLSDFKSEVRRTENFESNYIQGKYGAIPFLTDFSAPFSSQKIPDDKK